MCIRKVSNVCVYCRNIDLYQVFNCPSVTTFTTPRQLTNAHMYILYSMASVEDVGIIHDLEFR